MTARIPLIEMKRGDLKRLKPVTVQRIDDSFVDLTGCEVHWLLYRTNALNPFLVKKSSDLNPWLGVEILDAVSNEVSITIESKDTKDLQAGRYYHEIVVVTPSKQNVTVASGEISLVNKV